MKAIEVIDAIAAETNLKKKDIKAFFKSSAKLFALYLTDHPKLVLPGVGTFFLEIAPSKESSLIRKNIVFRPVKSLFTATPVDSKKTSSEAFGFIYYLSDRSNFSIEIIIQILNTLILLLKEKLLKYEKVTLPEWGYFKLKIKKSYEKSGHNSNTLFVARKKLIELINNPDLKDEKQIDYDLVSSKKAHEENKNIGNEDELLDERQLKNKVREAVLESTMMLGARKRKSEEQIAIAKKAEMKRLRIAIVAIIIASISLFFAIEKNENRNKNIANQSQVTALNPLTNTLPAETSATSVNLDTVVQDKPEENKPETETPGEKTKKTPTIKHLFTENDNLWELAQKYYNRGSFWPLILANNPAIIRNPDRIRNNTLLEIKPLEGSADSLTVADRKALFDAFTFTYQRFKQLSRADTTYLKRRARTFQ